MLNVSGSPRRYCCLHRMREFYTVVSETNICVRGLIAEHDDLISTLYHSHKTYIRLVLMEAYHYI